MNTATIEIKEEPHPDGSTEKTQNGSMDEIDELMAVLDRDIEHIQQSLSRLNKLRSLVVKRDETSLARLLESIQDETNSYTSNESRRRSIRKKLAVALDCKLEQLTLSRLEEILPGERKTQVATRKAKLRSLTEELKKERLSTALLLSDCARFNSLLLKSIFDLGSTGTVIYNSSGATMRQADTAFVNLQL